jgi:hypothetical protein
LIPPIEPNPYREGHCQKHGKNIQKQGRESFEKWVWGVDKFMGSFAEVM